MKRTNNISFAVLGLLNCVLGVIILLLRDAVDVQVGLGSIGDLNFIMKLCFYLYWWPFLLLAISVAGLITACRTVDRQIHLNVVLVCTLFLNIAMILLSGLSAAMIWASLFYDVSS